jgi:hypothetical protein
MEDFKVAGIPTSLYNCLSELHELTISAGGLGRILCQRPERGNEKREEREDRVLKQEAVMLHLESLFDVVLHSTYLGFSMVRKRAPS